ncbi:hypothetical protein BARVI_12050 [Barnesiella viscericola DSM 18177]|uniref:Uncharacterized protein n=1 Tax=Barnesiella viscericola DSM 18177 TaxID=880074 RepID=W0EWN6_9BACT|nr:ATP-binding protein [Barnesiella viscericola]AHF13983.1 hypothetical protein BARVI_12050 [Barnesiella viscericola DSM 18177]
MAELYSHLGFIRNPFSTYSAEEECEFLDDIYIKPKFFHTLQSDIANGHSRFILGARGVGKTALISQLKTNLEKDNIFSIIIDNFDGIPKDNNNTEFIRLIIEYLVKYYCIELGNCPKRIRSLNRVQKEKLSFFISEFFVTISSLEYTRLNNRTNIYHKTNCIKQIYNRFFNKPINYSISGCMEIASDFIRSHLGLPKVDKEIYYKNYLPECEIKQSKQREIPLNYRAYKSILSDFAEIIQKSGYKNVVIFFDKIDEFPQLNNNISLVANFLESLFKDTTILMDCHYSIVFSIWDAIKPELTNKGVRFDKIKPIDITWSNEEIKRIVEKRISYFSRGRIVLDSLIRNQNKIDDLINLSNHSPRYVFRLFSYIYDCQSDKDDMAQAFESCIIDKGVLLFCQNFDYYAIYPRSMGKVDVITNINRLLKIGKTIIKTNDYVSTYKVSTPTAISYIRIALNYNLIKELPETDKGAKQYTINDPVISHLIEAGITELRK